MVRADAERHHKDHRPRQMGVAFSRNQPAWQQRSQQLLKRLNVRGGDGMAVGEQHTIRDVILFPAMRPVK